MGLREFLEALLAGKRLEHSDWGSQEFVQLPPGRDALLVDEHGTILSLGTVLDEFGVAGFCVVSEHPRGTFAWARDMYIEGRTVRVVGSYATVDWYVPSEDRQHRATCWDARDYAGRDVLGKWELVS